MAFKIIAFASLITVSRAGIFGEAPIAAPIAYASPGIAKVANSAAPAVSYSSLSAPLEYAPSPAFARVAAPISYASPAVSYGGLGHFAAPAIGQAVPALDYAASGLPHASSGISYAAPGSELSYAAPTFKVAAPVSYAAPAVSYGGLGHFAAPAIGQADPALDYAASGLPHASSGISYAALGSGISYAAPAFKEAAPVAYATPVAKTITAEPSAPAHYDFGYAVNDPQTGDSKSQEESRRGDVVQGRYSLIDADGSKRTVEYTADDHHGFNAVVHKEPAAVAPAVTKVATPVVYTQPAVKLSAQPGLGGAVPGSSYGYAGTPYGYAAPGYIQVAPSFY